MSQPLDTRILRAAKALLSHDVSPQQAIILSECTGTPPPTMTALAILCGITTAAMTGSIDRMVNLGWVCRGSVEGDRRSISIMLTPEGSQVISRLNNAISTL